jgi:peroxiredoxin
MIELGELEAHYTEFEKRNARLIVVSIENPSDAQKTQAEFPELTVVADHDRNLIDAVSALHAQSAPDGGDTAAPTTILVDGNGTVRWIFRPDRVFTRLSPAQLLAAFDEHLR